MLRNVLYLSRCYTLSKLVNYGLPPYVYPRVFLGISTASSDFLSREHKTLPQQAISELQFQGDVETGSVECTNSCSHLWG